jgi:thiazole synthase ThiGH ThiG subunit
MMKRTHLELGGKDAFVIAEDADPEIAARAIAYAALINAGQVCTSTERSTSRALARHSSPTRSSISSARFALATASTRAPTSGR